MNIRSKYMVLFDLFFSLCATIRPKIRLLIDLFFYLHKTIRPKYMAVFDLFFLLCRTIQLKIWLILKLTLFLIVLIFPMLYSWKYWRYASPAIFMAVLPLYFVCYIHDSTALYFVCYIHDYMKVFPSGCAENTSKQKKKRSLWWRIA